MVLTSYLAHLSMHHRRSRAAALPSSSPSLPTSSWRGCEAPRSAANTAPPSSQPPRHRRARTLHGLRSLVELKLLLDCGPGDEKSGGKDAEERRNVHVGCFGEACDGCPGSGGAFVGGFSCADFVELGGGLLGTRGRMDGCALLKAVVVVGNATSLTEEGQSGGRDFAEVAVSGALHHAHHLFEVMPLL